MEKYHDNLLIATKPENFSLYDLVSPEKIVNYGFVFAGNANEEQAHPFTTIDLCSINAMIAPHEVIDKYFEKFKEFLLSKETHDKVIKSMDQFSLGFIGVWDYSMYLPNNQFLIMAFEDVNLDTDFLVSEEDKAQYQYTKHKALPTNWSDVNVQKIIHLQTGEYIFQNGEGQFLVNALHKLDKSMMKIQLEKNSLEEKIKP